MSEETTNTLNTTFNLENDYHEDPLVPAGNYYATVSGVSIDGEKYAIVWKLVLQGNGAVMSDGETEVEGSTLFFRNWLPRPGDEVEMTSTGRTTKFQSKVNQLAKFAKNMGLNMNTPQAIQEAVENAEWIGMDVLASVTTSEYQGTIRNEVSRLVKVTY
jgi:hypothetical protein